MVGFTVFSAPGVLYPASAGVVLNLHLQYKSVCPWMGTNPQASTSQPAASFWMHKTHRSSLAGLQKRRQRDFWLSRTTLGSTVRSCQDSTPRSKPTLIIWYATQAAQPWDHTADSVCRKSKSKTLTRFMEPTSTTTRQRSQQTSLVSSRTETASGLVSASGVVLINLPRPQ